MDKEPKMITIQVPENSLILVTSATKEECLELFNKWLKEFNIN